MSESNSVISELNSKLFDRLRELLDLPATCTSIKLNLEIGKIPSVEVTYYPKVKNLKKSEKITQKFEIVLRESE